MLWVFADTCQQFVDWSRANGWPVPDRGIRMLLPRLSHVQGWRPQPGDLVIDLGSIGFMEDGEPWEAWQLLRHAVRIAPAVGFQTRHRPRRHGISRDTEVFFAPGDLRFYPTRGQSDFFG